MTWKADDEKDGRREGEGRLETISPRQERGHLGSLIVPNNTSGDAWAISR